VTRTESLVLAGGLLCWALAPTTARAQLELRWEAPIECPTGADVRAEVARLLGGVLPAELSLRAEGEATRSDDGWTMRLHTSMGGEEGERELAGERCEELGEAAALILALMIDPIAVAENEPEEADPPPNSMGDPPSPEQAQRALRELGSPAPETADSPPTERSEVEPPPDAVEDPARPAREVEREVESIRITDRQTVERTDDASSDAAGEPLGGFFGLAGGVDLGSVPTVSGGLSLEGGFGIPLIEARVRATFVFAQRAARADDAGADVTTATVDARACVHPFDEARFLYGCLGLALGVSVAEGFGLSRDEVGVGTFGAAVGGLGVAWVVAPWFDLELDATVLVPFNPLEFAVRASPDEVFHTQEPVAGRLSVAAHLRFR